MWYSGQWTRQPETKILHCWVPDSLEDLSLWASVSYPVKLRWGTSLVVQWLRLRSQCRGPRFHPWLGNQIPHATTRDHVCDNWGPFKQIHKDRQLLSPV